MSSFNKEQKSEIQDMLHQGNILMTSEIKEIMHEIIDPLKEDVGKAIGKHAVLNTITEDNSKKIETLFIMHNKREEIEKKDIESFIGLKKDVEGLKRDHNNLGKKIEENISNDKEVESKIEDIKEKVAKTDTTLKVLYGVLTVALVIWEIMK